MASAVPRTSPRPAPEVDPTPEKEQVDLLLDALDSLQPSSRKDALKYIDECIRDLHFRWYLEEVSTPTPEDETEWSLAKKQIRKMAKLSEEFFDALARFRLDKRSKKALCSRGKPDPKEIKIAQFKVRFCIFKREAVIQEYTSKFAEVARIYFETMDTLSHRHDQNSKWEKLFRKVRKPVSAPDLGSNLLETAILYEMYDEASMPD